MESLAKLISAVASLAWPLIFALLLFMFFEPFKKLIESARGRKFTIKVAGNELTMEEASEQQRKIISDLQSKLAEVERLLKTNISGASAAFTTPAPGNERILWVDDRPKNNSFLVASLEEQGVKVDIARSTDEGIKMFQSQHYDIVISDMGRPGEEKAGINLAKEIKSLGSNVPYFIFCGGWAARNLRNEALQAGVTEITSSGTTLLSLLPLST